MQKQYVNMEAQVKRQTQVPCAVVECDEQYDLAAKS